jgi:hypothetical protein
MNRAHEPRLRGASVVAVALHAAARLTRKRFRRFPMDHCLSLMRMDHSPRRVGRRIVIRRELEAQVGHRSSFTPETNWTETELQGTGHGTLYEATQGTTALTLLAQRKPLTLPQPSRRNSR